MLTKFTTKPIRGQEPWADPAPAEVGQYQAVFEPVPQLRSTYRNTQDHKDITGELDSLHIEARPPADSIDQWTKAKSENLKLAALFRSIPTSEAADHANALSGCQSSFYMAPTSDGWTIQRSPSSLRRCHRRLCPIDALAAQRKARAKIDSVSDRLSSEGWHTTFSTLQAPAMNIPRFWKAWATMRNKREYRNLVSGAYVGVHLSRNLNIHAHALLASEQPLDPDTIGQWWPGNAWTEPAYNAAAAMSYAARPARALLLDDTSRLCELFAIVKGTTLTRKTGIVAEYWPSESPTIETVGPPIRYDWTWDDDEHPETGEYDITP